MDEKFQTSQQKEGAHHKAEGSGEGATEGVLPYGEENQPSGVEVQRSGDDQLKTSQQIRGEHKTIETSY